MGKKRLILGGVFATHTEMDEDGNITQRDEFHTRLYWGLWHSGAMKKLKGARLHVLLTIAQHADKNAEGFPGVRRLAELLPYNKDAINKAIKDLIKLGFLEREQLRGKKGRFGNNHYKIKYAIPDEDTETKELPCTENTDTDKTGDGKPGHKEDTSSKEDNKQEDVVVEEEKEKKWRLHSDQDVRILRKKFQELYRQSIPIKTAEKLVYLADDNGVHISCYFGSMQIRFKNKNPRNPIGALRYQIQTNWLLQRTTHTQKKKSHYDRVNPTTEEFRKSLHEEGYTPKGVVPNGN